MMTTPAIAAAVTSWPAAGVAMLILIVALFLIAAVLVNLSERPAPPEASPAQDLASAQDATPAQEDEDRELEETYNV